MLAMYSNSVQAKSFTSAMTYEILLIVVIGGINKATLGNFKGMGIEGIAVVSAIAAQKDPAAAARELLTLWKS